MVQTVATDIPSIRILLVEDFEPFRRFVSSMFQRKRHLQVVGEALDGLEAVQKAEELKPDLILLDVGLPLLNGIEAARRIRKLVPRSKILFLSQESDLHVVQDALGLGAMGYILKTQAGGELLVGIEAVIRDQQFVSSQLAGHDFTDNLIGKTPSVSAARALSHRVHPKTWKSAAATKFILF